MKRIYSGCDNVVNVLSVGVSMIVFVVMLHMSVLSKENSMHAKDIYYIQYAHLHSCLTK